MSGFGGPGTLGSGANNSAPDSVFASQATWYISWASGNDANDGKTAATALKTLAEWTRRTIEVVPTVNGLITVNILDTNPLSPPDLEIGYAAIYNGLRIVGTPTTLQTTTIGTYRAENTASHIARAITAAAINWATYATNSVRIRCPAKNAVAWLAADEGSHVGRISAPYASTTTVSPFVSSVTPTEFANGDTIVLESLPVIGEIRIEHATNISTSCTVVIENLETNGGNQTFTSTNSFFYNGGGSIFFVNCGVGSTFGQNFLGLIGCRVDKFSSFLQTSLVGCLLFFTYTNISGSTIILDVLSEGVELTAQGGEIQIDRPYACFDVSVFDATGAALIATGAGNIYLAAAVYGATNPYSAHVKRGGTIAYKSGFKPATTSFPGATADVNIDGTTNTWTSMPTISATTGSKIILEGS